MPHNKTSKQYQRAKHWVFLLNLALVFLVVRFLFESGLSFKLKHTIMPLAPNMFVLNGAYILCLSALFYAIHFPLSFFSGFFLEHKFKLSRQSFGSWLKDHIKQTMLSLIFIFLIVQGLYFFVGTFPSTWWAWAGGSWILLSFIMAKVTPDIIIPMFFKYSTIQSEELKKTIMALFQRCGFYLHDVYTINLSSKTKKVNAFFCGLGKNKRVVLGDTLLSNFSKDEIEVVVAHELAHYQHKDIIKILVVNSFFTFLGLNFVDKILVAHANRLDLPGINDIALFPVVAFWLYIFALIVTPIINTYSRHIEQKADEFSLEMTNKPIEFISLMEKLAKMNLADTAPNKFVEWFLYDHPTIEKRIRFAKTYLASLKYV
jgi:STE24 endopeptidase